MWAPTNICATCLLFKNDCKNTFYFYTILHQYLILFLDSPSVLYKMQKRFLDDVSIYHKTAAAGLSWGLFDSKRILSWKKKESFFSYSIWPAILVDNDITFIPVFSSLLFLQTWIELVIKRICMWKNMSVLFLQL